MARFALEEAHLLPGHQHPSVRGGELSDLQVTISEEGGELLVTVSASPTVLD